MIAIEVIYATPEHSQREFLTVDEGTKVKEVLKLTEILFSSFLDVNQCKVGIYGNFVELDHQLKDGDRLEFYRPLISDPKEIRRQRAKKS